LFPWHGGRTLAVGFPERGISMSNTRRMFFQSAALGLTGVSALAAAQRPVPAGSEGQPKPSSAAIPASEIQVPKMKFFNQDVSRLVIGCNPFYGYSHFNDGLSSAMKEYYTPARVSEVLHQCNSFGINTFNYFPKGRSLEDLRRFEAEGGHMHLIVQGVGDLVELQKTLKPLAIYYHGEKTDVAFQNGKMDEVREWCRQARDLGVVVGIGTHKPEVIAMVEEQGWDVDFYAGCVYNRTRTADELRKVLNGDMLEMAGEVYLQSDPPKMYRVMRQTKKPCFAFKVLAAGRISGRAADQAFQTAFESIKPTDSVFVGVFPRTKDEVRENAERVQRLLVRS
jgi:hypothetical protein